MPPGLWLAQTVSRQILSPPTETRSHVDRDRFAFVAGGCRSANVAEVSRHRMMQGTDGKAASARFRTRGIGSNQHRASLDAGNYRPARAPCPRSPFGRAKCIAITTTMAPTVRRRSEPPSQLECIKPTGYDQELLELFKKKAGFEVRQDIIPWTGILPGVTTRQVRCRGDCHPGHAGTHEDARFLLPGGRIRRLLPQAQGRQEDPGHQGSRADCSLGVEAGSAMLKLLPQLDDMLEGDRRQARQDRLLSGLPRGLSGSGAGPYRLCRQYPAQPGIDRQVEARHFRGR